MIDHFEDMFRNIIHTCSRMKVNAFDYLVTKLKRQERYARWNSVGSQAIQDITVHIDRAYKLFFDGIKSDRKAAPPSFKKRIKYKSIILKQAGYKLPGGNKVRIGKQTDKFHKSSNIEGIIKTLTIKRDPLAESTFFFMRIARYSDRQSHDG